MACIRKLNLSRLFENDRVVSLALVAQLPLSCGIRWGLDFAVLYCFDPLLPAFAQSAVTRDNN